MKPRIFKPNNLDSRWVCGIVTNISFFSDTDSNKLVKMWHVNYPTGMGDSPRQSYNDWVSRIGGLNDRDT